MQRKGLRSWKLYQQPSFLEQLSVAVRLCQSNAWVDYIYDSLPFVMAGTRVAVLVAGTFLPWFAEVSSCMFCAVIQRSPLQDATCLGQCMGHLLFHTIMLSSLKFLEVWRFGQSRSV